MLCLIFEEKDQSKSLGTRGDCNERHPRPRHGVSPKSRGTPFLAMAAPLLPPPLLPPTFDIHSPDPRDIGRAAASGALAFAVPALASHPLHVISARRSLDPANYRGFLQSARKSGLRGLWAGTTSLLARNALYGASLFSIYELVKSTMLPSVDPLHRTKVYAIASGAAGLVTCAVMCPVEAAAMKSAGRGLPIFGGFSLLLKEAGMIGGLYSGFGWCNAWFSSR
jgi:hypothetical protein